MGLNFHFSSICVLSQSKALFKWIRIWEPHSPPLKITYRNSCSLEALFSLLNPTDFSHTFFLARPSPTFLPWHLFLHFSPLHPHPLATKCLGNSQLSDLWASVSNSSRNLSRYFFLKTASSLKAFWCQSFHLLCKLGMADEPNFWLCH